MNRAMGALVLMCLSLSACVCAWRRKGRNTASRWGSGISKIRETQRKGERMEGEDTMGRANGRDVRRAREGWRRHAHTAEERGEKERGRGSGVTVNSI